MIATVNFGVPYMSMVSYAETVGAPISIWYITCYSIASIGARCAFCANPDFTFNFNRTVFQGTLILLVSGVMWIIFCWASTFGWFLVCSIMLGICEGVLCVVTSRVGIGTIPRDWIGGAWIAVILTHGIGIYGMTIFTAVVAYFTLQYYVAFITVGLMQIIVAFLAFLLPNEEDEGKDDPEANKDTKTTITRTYGGPCPPPFGGPLPYSANSFYKYRYCGGYDSLRYGSAAGGTSGLTKSCAYKCQCPICTKYGCIADCLPKVCAPGDSLIKDCEPAQTSIPSGNTGGQNPC
ncbi:unnamed protein product [Orchesella dallaii]|uniref:Uncharacterized protein n=1 Tax=Orchesella dallaii TaxID=48710 RepID=A0ABP1PPS9_9HEXA